MLIIQHPQEPDKLLGSARIAHLALPNSTLKIALSCPNLKVALGREAVPSRWAVLYLGSGIKSSDVAKVRPEDVAAKNAPQPALVFVNKKGEALPSIEATKAKADLEGIIILDGTWSQAKTLWWRNAWLLKCRRLVLMPQARSMYKELRKEPRRECLSIIESISLTLKSLGESDATANGLNDLFGHLLDRARKKPAKTAPSAAPAPAAPIAQS